MNKLIINTANKNLNIVLFLNNQVFYIDDYNTLHHNEAMLTLIDNLLTSHGAQLSDIDEIGVVVGPGSFTGIRVGISTIKAFRDALNIKAKGINNLDFLFALATKQFKDVTTVAILGSQNSYFVAKLINGVVYKFDYNLTKDELIKLSENKPIGMFCEDENLNCKVVKFDAEILLNCHELSQDYSLTPVYYQLSQAEREKLNRGTISVDCSADLNNLYQIQAQNITTNPMDETTFLSCLNNPNYKYFVAKFNGQAVGYILLQITDEVNIDSLAVSKDYRHLGIAKKLIEASINFAKQNNIFTLSLEVSEKNIPAYLLYKNLGFLVRRERKKYYQNGSTALEMYKTIN